MQGGSNFSLQRSINVWPAPQANAPRVFFSRSMIILWEGEYYEYEYTLSLKTHKMYITAACTAGCVALLSARAPQKNVLISRTTLIGVKVRGRK